MIHEKAILGKLVCWKVRDTEYTKQFASDKEASEFYNNLGDTT